MAVLALQSSIYQSLTLNNIVIYWAQEQNFANLLWDTALNDLFSWLTLVKGSFAVGVGSIVWLWLDVCELIFETNEEKDR